MSVLYEELVERIRGEVLDLERVVQRAPRAWSQAQKGNRASKLIWIPWL